MMSAARLPSPAPVVTGESRPYWEGAPQGRLTLPRCRSCPAVVWYPRAACPLCHSTDVEWFEASGRGTVYSYTVNRMGRADHPAYRGVPVYVLAYVELAEGPRVLTNIVDCDPAVLRCGLPVRAVFCPADGEGGLVRFAPGMAEASCSRRRAPHP
jgi:uncharacterized protein